MKLERCVLLCLAFAVLSSRSAAQTLGIYAQSDCTIHEICIPPGPPITLYVMVDQRQQPWWSTGLGSAGVLVTGIPTTWVVFATPNPAAAFVIGNPLSPGGAVIGFNYYMTDPCVLLYTLEVHPYSVESDLVLGLGPVDSGWPNVVCPWVYYPCDFPAPNVPTCVVPPMCATVQEMHIRSDPGCALAIQNGTWSSAKSLYR